MKWVYKILPWCFAALFVAEIIAVVMPKQETGFHTREFGRLPVLLNGRIQPFDSVGLNSLREIRGTGDVPLEGNGADGSWGEWEQLRKNPKALPLSERKWWQFGKHPKKLKATAWLLEVMMRPESADQRPIFMIHHQDILGELKLTEKGVANSLLHYFSYNELKPVREEIQEQAMQIRKSATDEQGRHLPEREKLWTPVQKQMVRLESAIVTYDRLKNSLRPQTSDDFAQELADFQKLAGPGKVAFRAQQEQKEFDQEALDRFAEPLNHYFVMSKWALPMIVPPLHSEKSRDEWVNAGTAILESVRGGELHPAITWFARMATAYRHDKPDEFNRAIAEYKEWLGAKFGPELTKGRREFFYNNVQGFLHAIIMYIFAFLLAGGSLLTLGVMPNLSESLRKSALYVVIIAGLVHTAGLIFRMVLEGRPPVTNLYSSAIFIGWGAMVLGLVLEKVYRVGIGLVVASLAGFVTLIIAHNLALGGDTMEMLRAVLDTNFWLATHVVVVTLGYASTFVAGLLAILYIFLGVFTPVLTHKLGQSSAAGGSDLSKALAKMVYGIVCFATLFSFTGTVLGGIWADQSWGRFWGWDPKENGALIIVIWNVIILHARWGGLVRERGLMNLAVFGNVVTSFSWFGVNMLGIGLHSYGFMDAAFKWLMAFVASQLLIIALGLLPKQYWRSFRGQPPSGPISGSPEILPEGAKA
ncbi:MAG TPA: cytochrome c biogenesis protein CcsA [Verrucomicrobiae bacterium]|nr:cytochrome c biogenesis protein CcsA [Verrucomicrobiae bacterium]